MLFVVTIGEEGLMSIELALLLVGLGVSMGFLLGLFVCLSAARSVYRQEKADLTAEIFRLQAEENKILSTQNETLKQWLSTYQKGIETFIDRVDFAENTNPEIR
jgi:hypothetical protein